MDESRKLTVERPGKVLDAPSNDSPEAMVKPSSVVATCSPHFSELGNLSKVKPVRRPNRSRPLETNYEGVPSIRETYPAQERAALRAGWDDPDLDEYDKRYGPQS